MENYENIHRRHLPHWQPLDATFFVTFRLKNSLSYEVITSLQEERERARVASYRLPECERTIQNMLDDQRYFERWEEHLNRADFGHHYLAQPNIASIVKEALHYQDGRVYDLHAYCIMSNHVHIVFEPLSKSNWQSDLLPLNKIMQSLKRHTARQANIILGREGTFWQDESYDHVIRNNNEYIRIVNYVLENPVKAGLISQWDKWQWTYCRSELLSKSE